MELKGTATVVGDIVGPVVPAHYWDSLAAADETMDPGRAVDANRKQGRKAGGE